MSKTQNELTKKFCWFDRRKQKRTQKHEPLQSGYDYCCAYKVTHALYLDMGRGWNYAWFRNEDGKVKEIFPESKLAPSYKYRTNWITFYK